MPRNVSQAFRDAFYAQQTEEAAIVLLTIEHAQIPVPLRLALNTQPITSRGNVFAPFFFEVVFPSEDPETTPTVSLRIDNVDRTIAQALDALETPPTVLLEIVLASQPDVVEVATPRMVWRTVTVNEHSLEGVLSGPEVFNRATPRHTLTPAIAPGLFTGLP